MHLTRVLGAALLPLLALSASLRITIPPSPSLPNPATLPPSTTASLTTLGHAYAAPLDTTHAFAFRNVSTGSYLLDVTSATHVFAPLRVDISPGADGAETVAAWGTWRGNEWENKGEAVEVGVWGRDTHALAVRAVARKEHLVERTGCELLP